MTSLAAPTNVISTGSAFGQRFSRKENDQSLRVLRHSRRFPSPSASFVQQIGEGVLVFARSAGQFDDNSLILFHCTGFVSLSFERVSDETGYARIEARGLRA